ncbi:MAG TPA: hypothetical protein VHQ01_04780 [Pyrinomonadaceae bacterium]|nr:hypothetical protein [Pyrinomonadaceae bacterium]
MKANSGGQKCPPFFMQLNNFYNDGFGWICRHCESQLAVPDETPSRLSRAFREGEAESKTPTLANQAIAKWTDNTRQFLICPRCGITEAPDAEARA